MPYLCGYQQWMALLHRRRLWRLTPTHAEARNEILQAADQEVRFAVALDQRFDGLVFAVDLLAQKIALVFRLLDFLSSRST